MREIQEPEQRQELETRAISPRKATATSIQQTLLLLLGFAAVLAGLTLYILVFLRVARWLLDTH